MSVSPKSQVNTSRVALQRAFEERFGCPLPESVNASHRIVVSAASIDSSSERIINYLSDVHGVNINAVTFQYFRASSGMELLSRVFLKAPSEVEYSVQTRSPSKRRASRSLDDFMNTAQINGTGDEFREILNVLKPVFASVRTTLTTVNLIGEWAPGRTGAILNLLPDDSSSDLGIRFQLYDHRLASLCGVSNEEIHEILPPQVSPWSYDGRGNPEWEGVTGYMRAADAERLAAFLQRARDGHIAPVAT